MTKDELHKHAEHCIPERTLEQVKAFLENAKAKGADMSAARLLLNHGRLTDDAKRYVQNYVDGGDA